MYVNNLLKFIELSLKEKYCSTRDDTSQNITWELEEQVGRGEGKSSGEFSLHHWHAYATEMVCNCWFDWYPLSLCL